MSSKLKKEFYGARKKLEELERELPSYERLLADNERAESERRRIKANLDELAQAKTRTQAARELLEQHHHDMNVQRAEVARLEADFQRAQTLDKMAEFAKDAQAQQEAFNTAMLEANRQLEPFVTKLHTAWDALNRARSDFLKTGRTFSRGFYTSSWPRGVSSEDVKREEAAMREALEAVKARGVDLTAALTPHNGRKASMADLGVWQDAPSPEPYGALLWQAMAAREEDRFNEAHRALRAEDARRARAKTEPQPERVPMLEVTIDLKHEEHVKRASAMLRNVAKNAYQETRPGATSLAVWALRQSDAAAVDRLKSELPEGVVTVR